MCILVLIDASLRAQPRVLTTHYVIQGVGHRHTMAPGGGVLEGSRWSTAHLGDDCFQISIVTMYITNVSYHIRKIVTRKIIVKNWRRRYNKGAPRAWGNERQVAQVCQHQRTAARFPQQVLCSRQPLVFTKNTASQCC